MMTSASILSLILRVLLLAACFAGVYSSLFKHEGGFMNGGGILYYTIQSNLWVLLMTAVYLGLSLAGIAVPQFVQIARFAVLVAITITFLVFWILLAPVIEKEYLMTINNFLVHTLVPLLFIADFFLFDRIAPLPRTSILFSMALPLYYLLFSLIHPKVNPNLSFQDGSRYPYFFIDVDKNGWFRLKGSLGVCWWILIMLCLTLGLSFLYRFLLSTV